MLLQTTDQTQYLSSAQSWTESLPLSFKSCLEDRSLLPAERFVHSNSQPTEDILVYIANQLLHARYVGKTTGFVFIDLSKAFGCVEHQTLINELADIGLKQKALQRFVSSVRERSQANIADYLSVEEHAATVFHREVSWALLCSCCT